MTLLASFSFPVRKWVLLYKVKYLDHSLNFHFLQQNPRYEKITTFDDGQTLYYRDCTTGLTSHSFSSLLALMDDRGYDYMTP